jgi:hypothetical protein
MMVCGLLEGVHDGEQGLVVVGPANELGARGSPSPTMPECR